MLIVEYYRSMKLRGLFWANTGNYRNGSSRRLSELLYIVFLEFNMTVKCRFIFRLTLISRTILLLHARGRSAIRTSSIQLVLHCNIEFYVALFHATSKRNLWCFITQDCFLNCVQTALNTADFIYLLCESISK